MGFKKEIVTVEPDYESLYNDHFKLIFDTLKANRIFTLPDQNELKLQDQIFDGGVYVITYKAGNKFRRYTCRNMQSYLQTNPTVNELQNYIMIVKYLVSLFN